MKTLTAFYDLAVGPVSYDFVVFAVQAEMARVRSKAEKLHIVIVPDPNGVDGMFRDKTHLYPAEEMHWRLWNICIPAANLLRATVTLATDWDQARRLAVEPCWPQDWNAQTLKNRKHLVGDLIKRSRAGEPVPKLRCSTYANNAVWERFTGTDAGPDALVTMTVRSTYMDERNSDFVEWARAQKHIEQRGYNVEILRDVSQAVESEGYGELNLDLRMALYERAGLNLQENNGTASLCWFSGRPYRMFGANNNPEEWDGLFVKQGLTLGEQWPWARVQQQLVYKPASADAIIEEFETWVGATRLS